MLGEAAVDATSALEGQLNDARYAVIHVGDRAYAFPVHAAGVADGDVWLSVRGHATEGTATTEAHAGTAGQVPLTSVAATLAWGVTGDRDLFIAARRENGAFVVTHITPRLDLTPGSTVDATEEHVVTLLHEGTQAIFELDGEARTFGELTVRTGAGPRNVLDADLWESVGEQGAEGDLEVGLGLPFD